MKIEKKTIYNKNIAQFKLLHNSNKNMQQDRFAGAYCCHYERLRSSLNYRRTLGAHRITACRRDKLSFVIVDR